MFNRMKKLKPLEQALFALLIGLSVVAFWRGAWGIMDVYIFPDNYELSSWISMAIGLIILYSTHYWTRELV